MTTRFPKNFAKTLCLALLATGFSTSAQSFRFRPAQSIPVLHNADTLANAWAGGLNAAQYATMRLNDDAVDDLVVFDRYTSQVSTFVAERTGTTYRWRHAPRYQTQFPSMRNWMLLVDYDNDGRKDIFTHTEFGMRVLRNVSAGGNLAWTTASDLLLTDGSSGPVNISLSAADYPAVTDVDNDGDIDVLATDATGHLVYWYQNTSMEQTGRPGLQFRTASRCWGQFEGSEVCGAFELNAGCDTDPLSGNSGGRIMHTGSALLIANLRQAPGKDLLLSNVSCANLTLLRNAGTPQQARMGSFVASYPESRPSTFPYPAAFYEDLDFDGRKDLLVAPNVGSNDGNLYDFTRSNWLYRNAGTSSEPDFAFVEDAFLQRTMIDVGEMSTPALTDLDADGDLDLVLGNAGTPNNGRLLGVLTVYENIGTRANPTFRLQATDYEGFSALQASNLKPYFLDWNRDGATDLVLMSTVRSQTSLNVFLNQARAGQPYRFLPGTSLNLPLGGLRPEFAPCFYDVDNDSNWDVLLGKNLGELEYHRNTGTNAAPAFTRINPSVGGLPLGLSDRSQAPLLADWNADGRVDLLSAYRNSAEPPYGGRLWVADDILPTFDATVEPEAGIVWNEARSVYDTLPLPAFIAPAVGDLNNDGMPDLVLGTGSGGVLLLLNESTGGQTTAGEFSVNPNPANGPEVFFLARQEGQATVFNLLGQQLTQPISLQANVRTPVNVANWASGLYVVRFNGPNGSLSRRMVVSR